MSEIKIDYGVTIEDIEVVARDARELERIDFLRNADTVEEALTQSCLVSDEVRTGYIDGTPIAIFGLTGQLEDGTRAPWLILSMAATEHPFIVARRSREIVDDWIARHGDALGNLVPVEDEPAIALLRFCGFEIHDPVDLRGHAYHPFTRRPES